ncbi:MAG: helix-turn-helix transcriptional regulator [Deltaproteobacteria bacterium]|nr:helix-turn-helix transcriptional regulator [Deltaproteobacteria bacterium]
MKNKTLGGTIKEARMAKGISLRKFADEIGVSPPHVSDIENDNRKPSDELLGKIAKNLDLSFDELEKMKGKIGDKVKDWVKREPEAAVLMRKIAGMSNGLDRLREIAEEGEKNKGRK